MTKSISYTAVLLLISVTVLVILTEGVRASVLHPSLNKPLGVLQHQRHDNVLNSDFNIQTLRKQQQLLHAKRPVPLYNNNNNKKGHQHHQKHARGSSSKRDDSNDNCLVNPFPASRPHHMLPFNTPLPVGKFLESKYAKVQLEKSGILTLRHKAANTIMWNSSTEPHPNPAYAIITSNGIELRDEKNKTYWSNSITTPNTAVLTLHDNCNLALFALPPFTNQLWATETNLCLDVHIVPHSHDDVGWILTPERYYDGCYDPNGGVQSIISSMVEALLADKTRHFIQVEMYFFHRWWVRQTAAQKEQVRGLVKSGQLQFINGGWSMHDEACVHQESAIANMARGAQFLREEFGLDANLTIGWHIDPFGHASTTPRIMSQMGYNAFFFWRTDYQHRELMLNTKTLETMWDSSDAMGKSVYMFTSIMPDGYCKGCDNDMCPSGFCCFSCQDASEPHWSLEFAHAYRHARPTTDARLVRKMFRVAEDKKLTIKEMADAVVQSWSDYADNYRTSHVLIPWGCDFQHIDAFRSFMLMDEVLHEIKKNSKYSGIVNAFYSTPTEYVKQVKEENYTWPVNSFDYFLDSDNGHSYWSGYPSSRAEYKHFERVLMNQRSATDIMLSSLKPDRASFRKRWDNIDELRQALGVAQHHDSITGTERHSVRNQYQKILTDAMVSAHEAAGSMLEEITGLRHPRACALSNLSSCLSTQPLSRNQPVSVILFNPLQWQTRSTIVTIPVPVKDIRLSLVLNGREDSAPIRYSGQVQDTWELTTTEDPPSPPVKPMPYEVLLSVDLAPLQSATLVLSTNDSYMPSSTPLVYVPSQPLHEGQRVTLGNSRFTAGFVAGQGPVSYSSMNNKNNNNNKFNKPPVPPQSFNVSYAWYCPMSSNNHEQAAGAYIMRTCTPDAKPTPLGTAHTRGHSTLVAGPVCREYREVVDTEYKIHQAWRVCGDEQEFLEQLLGIGEIPAGEEGREIIMMVQSEIKSKSIWYTDSQGLEMQRRVRNARPNYQYNVTENVAGNFFPCNQWAFITSEEEENNHNNNNDDSITTLAVIGDSHSTASMHDGELEFLLLRRLLFDDGRGVDQALNESIRLQTINRFVFGTNRRDVVTVARRAATTLIHSPLVYYSDQVELPHYTGLPFPPKNNNNNNNNNNNKRVGAPLLDYRILLHTREMLDERTMLIRLQHIYDVYNNNNNNNDSNNDDNSVLLELATVLPDPALYDSIFSVEEMDMNGVTPLADMNKMRHQYNTCLVNNNNNNNNNNNHHHQEEGKTSISSLPTPIPTAVVRGSGSETVIKMKPMDIRTFRIVFKY